MHKFGDEKLVIYDTNLKLASIMPFWVYHWKRKSDNKIRHQISIETLKLWKKYFWVTQRVTKANNVSTIFFFFFEVVFHSVFCRSLYYWLKTDRTYAKYSRIIITVIVITIIIISIMILTIITIILIIITMITVMITKMMMMIIIIKNITSC